MGGIVFVIKKLENAFRGPMSVIQRVFDETYKLEPLTGADGRSTTVVRISCARSEAARV